MRNIVSLLALSACTLVAQDAVRPGLPAGPTTQYVSNKAPLRPLELTKLPVGAVVPGGWLASQLQLMTAGFSGRLSELSQFCKYDGNAWTDASGHGRFGWEELPYWLKGYIDLGYVTGDRRIIDDSTRWVEAVLKTQGPDGYFGARTNLVGKNTLDDLKALDLWPNMVMLYVLRTHYEATGDARIIPFMLRYYRWFMTLPLEAILPGSWQKHRGGDNLDHIYWLYNHTGEAWLLDAARLNHERTSDWVGSIPTWHGVNVSECFREPAQYFQQTGDVRYLKASERVYDTIFGLYGQVPGGGFASDENARAGFNGPRQGTETCTWVEFMFSHEMLAGITGEAKWADRAEEIAFNSLPASMTPDLKGLHYITAPNQVQLDRADKAPFVDNTGELYNYDPYGYRCCQHNTAMGWPYYAERLWTATRGDGLAAMFYAASTVKAKVAGGREVRIEESTDYPFSETVNFTLHTSAAARFPLALRIPAWCDAPRLSLNGKPLSVPKPANGWLTVERAWADNDRLELTLPMQLSLKRWPAQRNAASVYYGPLAFSLKIGEQWKPYGDKPEWQKLEVFPTTPWNYALEPDSKLTLEKRSPRFDRFTPDAAPLLVHARGRRIPEWQLEPNGLIQEIQLSPVATSQPAEDLTLIPLGFARLRLSVFPVAGGTRKWDPNPPVVFASVMDHFDPPGAPGFSWSGRQGAHEWVEYRYARPKTVSTLQVEWEKGLEPAATRLLVLDGTTWREVKGSQFAPVTSTAFRLDIQMERRRGAKLKSWSLGGTKE